MIKELPRECKGAEKFFPRTLSFGYAEYDGEKEAGFVLDIRR
jgi:hypothetical protein